MEVAAQVPTRVNEEQPMWVFVESYFGSLSTPDSEDPDEETETLYTDSLRGMAERFRSELRLEGIPRLHAFSNLTHRPLPANDPIETCIHGILDEAHKANRGVIFVLRRWDSITADKDSFNRIFSRGIDHFQLKVRLKINDAVTPAVRNPLQPNFVDVNPVDVCMYLNDYVDPDKPFEGLAPNTELFLKRIGKISYDRRPTLNVFDY